MLLLIVQVQFSYCFNRQALMGLVWQVGTSGISFLNPSGAPIPGSVLLLGSGSFGLVGIGMRKKSA